MIHTNYNLVLPTIIADSVDDEFRYQQEFIDYCYSCPDKVYGVEFSNQKGWQSPGFTKETNVEFFQQQFYPDFEMQLNKTIASMNLYPNVKYEVSNYWININYPGSYNTTHIHPHSQLSGVFYVKTPDKCGNILFQHSVEALNPLRQYIDMSALDPIIGIVPRSGTMIIFNSYLPHSVESNDSEEDRISIAFNIKLKAQ